MALRACPLLCRSSLSWTDKSDETAAVVYSLSHKRIVQPLPHRRPGPSTRENHCTTTRMRVVPHPPGVYPTYTSCEISDQAFPAFNWFFFLLKSPSPSPSPFNCPHTHDNAAYNVHVSVEAWERGYTRTTRGKPGAIVVDRERGSPGPHAERGEGVGRTP